MYVLFLCIFILMHFFLFALYCISVTCVTFNDPFISNILFVFTTSVWLLFAYWPFIIVASCSLFVCFMLYYHNFCVLSLAMFGRAGPCFPLYIKIKTIIFVYLLLILSFFCYYFVTWRWESHVLRYRQAQQGKREREGGNVGYTRHCNKYNGNVRTWGIVGTVISTNSNSLTMSGATIERAKHDALFM